MSQHNFFHDFLQSESEIPAGQLRLIKTRLQAGNDCHSTLLNFSYVYVYFLSFFGKLCHCFSCAFVVLRIQQIYANCKYSMYRSYPVICNVYYPTVPLYDVFLSLMFVLGNVSKQPGFNLVVPHLFLMGQKVTDKPRQRWKSRNLTAMRTFGSVKQKRKRRQIDSIVMYSAESTQIPSFIDAHWFMWIDRIASLIEVVSDSPLVTDNPLNHQAA